MNKKMKAAVVKNSSFLEIEELDIPECGPDDVLIRIASCALCSSDIRVIKSPGPGQPPYGEFIPGHEYSGTVAAVGDRVDEFSIGDRVAVEAHYGCGRCFNCRRGLYTSCLNWGNRKRGHRANGKTTSGGFAEYAVNHVSTVFKIPDSVSFNEAALVTNAGCVLYGLEKTGGYLVGDKVVIIGDGPIGLIALQTVKMLGADNVVLVGLDDYKMKLAEDFGADTVLDAEKTDYLQQIKSDSISGADLSIEASGSGKGIQDAMKLAKWGGKVLLIGIPKNGGSDADFKDMIRGNKDLFTVRGEGLSSCGRALSLLKNERMNLLPLISHTFNLEDINKALEVHLDDKVRSIKIIVNPSGQLT